MPKITKHVPVRRGFDTVWLKPGDELPDWAVGLVGDHALDAASLDTEGDDEARAGESSDLDETPELDPEPQVDQNPAASEVEGGSAPDFTKPAPAKRGRPRRAE